ncbi:MAG: hypothetical protein J6V00_08300, partial [Bacteroidaceae bacterium]|nr:hypothetical protein [Bacteroidaceae bacterium]
LLLIEYECTLCSSRSSDLNLSSLALACCSSYETCILFLSSCRPVLSSRKACECVSTIVVLCYTIYAVCTNSSGISVET